MQDQTGVERGWQMMYSRWAGLNIMTLQQWRKRGTLPAHYLHEARKITADAKRYLQPVQWSPEMRDRFLDLLTDCKERTLQQTADILTAEFGQSVTPNHLKSMKRRLQGAHRLN